MIDWAIAFVVTVIAVAVICVVGLAVKLWRYREQDRGER